VKDTTLRFFSANIYSGLNAAENRSRACRMPCSENARINRLRKSSGWPYSFQQWRPQRRECDCSTQFM